MLDVREAYGVRLLQVKNPWAHKRWKGKYSAGDTARWTPQLKSALNYDPVSAMQFDNGIFWIDYDSMLRYYRGIYFNWNPGLFMYQQVRRSCCPALPTLELTHSLSRCATDGACILAQEGTRPHQRQLQHWLQPTVLADSDSASCHQQAQERDCCAVARAIAPRHAQ